MVANFDSVQQVGKDHFEAVSAATAAFTKGLQGIATETTDYSKKSFEKSRELAEKLVAVKKIDEAVALAITSLPTTVVPLPATAVPKSAK